MFGSDYGVLRTNCNAPKIKIKKKLFTSSVRLQAFLESLAGAKRLRSSPKRPWKGSKKKMETVHSGLDTNTKTSIYRQDWTWAHHFDTCFMMFHNDTVHDLHDPKLGLSSMIGKNGVHGKNKSIHKDLWIQYIALI